MVRFHAYAAYLYLCIKKQQFSTRHDVCIIEQQFQSFLKVSVSKTWVTHYS